MVLVRYCPFAHNSHVPPPPVPDSPASHFEHLAEPSTAFSPVPQASQLEAAGEPLNVFSRQNLHNSCPVESM